MDILLNTLALLAGCGVFMVGMRLMGEGLERGAGGTIRKIFAKINDNRAAGVGIGAGVTAIIQSSSATTVMVIGFVNAGVMTLVQATSIIMGANIGTTVTGILVSLSSLPIAEFAMALAFVGVFISMFSKKDSLKHIGSILAGLGLIFVGLDFMSSAFKSDDGLSAIFQNLFTTIEFPLFLILFGAAFTAIIQSSSAASALVITLVGSSVLGVDNALFIILGTNIGTCVTALLAAVGASTNAKRASFIHLAFNLIGTILFTVILLIFQTQIISVLEVLSPTAAIQIAYFHVFFNVTTTFLLLPFIKQLTWLAMKVIHEKEVEDEEVLKLTYLDDRILQTPSIAVAQVLKEVLHMGEIAQKNLRRSINCLITQDLAEQEKILLTEKKINFINKSIGRYLVKLCSGIVSYADEKTLAAMYHAVADIERIGDYAKNFVGEAREMNENKTKFTEIAQIEISEMHAKVEELFNATYKAFETRDIDDLEVVSKIENEVDDYKRKLTLNHIDRLNKQECDVDVGVTFYAVVAGLERVADHLNNVAFSTTNKRAHKTMQEAK